MLYHWATQEHFLHQVPQKIFEKIFGFPSTTIMTNIKIQFYYTKKKKKKRNNNSSQFYS